MIESWQGYNLDHGSDCRGRLAENGANFGCEGVEEGFPVGYPWETKQRKFEGV